MNTLKTFFFIIILIIFVNGEESTKPKNDKIVKDIDGNEYKTVKIGAQEWMTENLKVTKYRNGEPISDCWAYKNDDSNADTYGRLYSWYAVNDSRNIAPAGWHVPTDEEWKELERVLGMNQSELDKKGNRGTNEGSKLADRAVLWNDGDLENNAEFGTSGFAALPAGYRNKDGSFYDLGNYTRFWSTTESGSIYILARRLCYGNAKFYRHHSYRDRGFSIRLLKD